MKMLVRALAAVMLLGASSVSFSQETVTYTYDAKGRLKTVVRSGSINDGVTAAYQYDAADNRLQVSVGGAGPAGPAFSIADASGTEGGQIALTVTRSGDTSVAQSVNYASAGQTATPGVDFTAVSGTLNFAIGETSRTIPVTTLQDTTYEGNETFVINLSAPTNGAGIADPQGIGTIVEDDERITFSISDVTAAEGEVMQFVVTKVGNTPNTYSLNYATLDGDARSAEDYAAASGTLVFGPNDFTRTISVAITDDVAFEQDEIFYVDLSNASVGTELADGRGIGLIPTNDVPPPPTFSVGDATNLEGYAVTFTVTRSGQVYTSASVDYATAYGTAGANDFTARTGTLSFASGVTTRTFTVQTQTDALIEGSETFYVNLSNPTGSGVIDDGQGIGTIADANNGDPGEECPPNGCIEPCPTCRGTVTGDPAPTDPVAREPDEPGVIDGPGL